MTIHRCADVAMLRRVAAVLVSRGFEASIVVPENEWVDGLPYLVTTGSYFDVTAARRA